MSIKSEVSEKRFEKDTFLGLKCSGNSKEFYTETQTTICEVCGKKQVFITEVTNLLHVPSSIRHIIDRAGPRMSQYEWGYKKKSFWACSSHSELELDKKVAFLKKAEAEK